MNYLEKGDVIQITGEHKIYAKVPKHFVFSNCKGDFEICESDIRPTGELSYLAGRYVVVDTKMQGGGQGHGRNDIYPDGLYVKCVSQDGKHEIGFYQSGCFTAMIEDIEPIGKAKLEWVIEK